MKTLKDNILLYDCECPMCRVYSGSFIAAGMLDKNGRMNYASMDEQIKKSIDLNRARNEIALINTKDKTVTYGIFSLFAIISHSFPIFKGLFSFVPFVKIMKVFYSFVSFNRRIIICGNDPENPLACNPDFNIKYRVAYLIFASVFSGFILKEFNPLLENWWAIPKGWYAELLLIAGQLAFQALILFLIDQGTSARKIFDYLGNLMTVSLFGALLIVPALILNSLFTNLSVYVYLTWFVLVVIAMFLEHKRRVKVYNLPIHLTYSWILYRVFVSIFCLIYFE